MHNNDFVCLDTKITSIRYLRYENTFLSWIFRKRFSYITAPVTVTVGDISNNADSVKLFKNSNFIKVNIECGI